MSKQLDARVTCNSCGRGFNAKFYRSLWIEEPKNRALVFSDAVNAIACPACKIKVQADVPVLCTNLKRGFAVWYEPYPDPDVEADVRQYAKQFGPTSFYAMAPRLRTWTEVKQRILRFEAETPATRRVSESPEAAALLRGFLDHIKAEGARRGPSWWRGLRRSVRVWVAGVCVWVIGVPLVAYAFRLYGSSMNDEEAAHLLFWMLVPPAFAAAVVVAWNQYVK